MAKKVVVLAFISQFVLLSVSAQPPELLGEWLLDNNPGYDSSGNTNHGTLVNIDPGTASGPGYLTFGENYTGRVEVPDAAYFDTFGSFTVEARVRWRGPADADYDAIVSKWGGGGASDNEWGMLVNDGYLPYFEYANEVEHLGAVSDLALPTDEWHVITGVFHAGVRIAIYIDGVLTGEESITQEGPRQSTVPMMIGNRNWLGGTWGPFNGDIDYVRLWRGLRLPEPRGDVVLLNEDFDGYASGDWPAGFYQFEHDYEYYPGTHVVTGITPACPSPANCFMNTNPYNGSGGDVTVPFSFDPDDYDVLIFEADLMFPSSSSGGIRNDVGLKLVPSPTDRRTILAVQLIEPETSPPVPPEDQLFLAADDGGSRVFLSHIGDFDEWIHIRGVLDLDTATYAVYANGLRVGTNLGMNPGFTVSDIGALFLSKGYLISAPGYFDNVVVSAATLKTFHDDFEDGVFSGWSALLGTINDDDETGGVLRMGPEEAVDICPLSEAFPGDVSFFAGFEHNGIGGYGVHMRDSLSLLFLYVHATYIQFVFNDGWGGAWGSSTEVPELSGAQTIELGIERTGEFFRGWFRINDGEAVEVPFPPPDPPESFPFWPMTGPIVVGMGNYGPLPTTYCQEFWATGRCVPTRSGERRVSWVVPSSASPGDSLDVQVFGANTHFDVTSEVDFGPGTYADYISVKSPTGLTTSLTISWDAVPGPRDVTVATGAEVVVGEDMFTILGDVQVPPPSGLTATAGASSIFLQWEPCAGYYVTGYNVYRDVAIDGSYEMKLNGTSVTDTSYEDTDVTPGGTYYYKVTAVTDDPYESEKSDPAWATVGQIVITMPDIRGDAGDSVRLPINLDCAWGVNGSGMEIHVTYDTSLLTPTALEKTVLTEGFTFVDNIDVADGQIDIAGVGGGSMVGEGHILEILFEVDPDAVLDDTGTFIFVDVVMYDWELTELDVDYSDTATFTVSPYYVLGDVTGDGEVDAADAILAQRIADGEIEPTALQLLAGDINGDGVIDSADVTLILRLVLGLPINPDGGTPKAETVQAAQSLTPPDAAGGTPRVVSIGNASGQHGDTVSVAVTINDASDVAGCDLTITFDSTAFEVTDVAVSTLTSGFSIEWHQSGGTLTISLASGTPISSGSGDLCTISLRVREGAILGETLLNLASVKLSGEHGEDLSWEAEVSKSSGMFTVLSAEAVPAASGLLLLLGLGVGLAAIGTRKRKR